MDLAQQWYQLTNEELNLIQRVYSRLNWQYSSTWERVSLHKLYTRIKKMREPLDSLFGSFSLVIFEIRAMKSTLAPRGTGPPIQMLFQRNPIFCQQTIYCCNNKCYLPNGHIYFSTEHASQRQQSREDFWCTGERGTLNRSRELSPVQLR